MNALKVILLIFAKLILILISVVIYCSGLYALGMLFITLPLSILHVIDVPIMYIIKHILIFGFGSVLLEVFKVSYLDIYKRKYDL